jgi:O-antigen ligase
MEAQFALSPRAILTAFTRQPLSFWLVCLYMLFEYVRPQAIYTWLQGMPWSQILILAAPIAYLLEGGGIKARNPINLWMALFTIAIGLSWATAQYPALSQEKFSIWINWMLVYFLVANVCSTQQRFFLFFLLFLLFSLKMSQFGARTWAARGFGFEKWGATGAPGWFHNSGEFGIQMCIFFPLSLYFISGLQRHWSKLKRILVLALPATAVMSVIATNSRGAMLGLAAVGLWILLRTRYRVRALIGLGFLAVLAVLVMPPETKERFASMGEDETSVNRLTFWEHGIEIFAQHPVSGIGYENWAEYYRQNYGRTALPHNIFVQAGAELGSLGLVTLLGLIVSSFVVTWRIRRVAHRLGEAGRFLSTTARGLDGAMIGYLASGFFVTVLFYPYLWFALGMTSALYAATLSEAAKTAPARPSPVPLSLPPVALQSGAGWRTAASQRAAAQVLSHRRKPSR